MKLKRMTILYHENFLYYCSTLCCNSNEIHKNKSILQTLCIGN